jgi:DNA-binding PadR family transcriptional regulator
VASGIPRYIEPVILLILRQKGASYGYELMAEGTKLSLNGEPIDPGSIYKILRRMEMEGLVISQWDLRDGGPPRRYYRITETGSAMLNNWVEELKRRRGALEYFISTFDQLSQ